MNNNNISSRNGNSSTAQACAACKYQRRKCAPDCILAPYFPHDRQRQFLNAHKLFGVSNITKIIKYLDPPLKDQAMRTIIFQSDMRANDPVGGCYKYIQDLQAQIDYYRAELDLVLQQLAIVQAQAQAQAQQLHHHHVHANADVDVMNANAAIYNNPNPAVSSFISATPNYHYLQTQQQDQYIMLHENNNGNGNGNTTPLQEHINTWAMQNSMSLSSLSLHGQSSNASDEFDQKPMLDLPSDERNDQLGFDSGELVHHSDEGVVFKIDDDAVINAEGECIQQSQDHDLKGAATLFTLTNCTS